jgi:hypothetical protein
MIRAGGVEQAKPGWPRSAIEHERMGRSIRWPSSCVALIRESAAEFIRDTRQQSYARDAVAGLAEEMSRKDVQQGLKFANSLNGPNQSRLRRSCRRMAGSKRRSGKRASERVS